MDALAAKLGICLAQAVGHMEMLFHLTAKHTPHGNIGKMPNAYIAKKSGWDGDPEVFVSALIECRWLDSCTEQRLIVHDWHEHCDDATKKSVSRSETSFFRPVLPKADNGGQCPTMSDKICLPSLAKPSQATPSPPECEADDVRPKQRDLSTALILPPLITEAMKAYTPEIQRQAWEVTQEFQSHSPGNRSTQKLGEIAAVFADAMVSRPGARDKLTQYFSVTDPLQIEREVKEFKRLRPGSSPWEVVKFLFPPGKAKQPTSTAPDPVLERERAKNAKARDHPAKIGLIRELAQSVTRKAENDPAV